jgi:hypothetical protein
MVTMVTRNQLQRLHELHQSLLGLEVCTSIARLG